jgi:hypothetical protein
MYSSYVVPPACFLPRFYNNQTKLMELCSNGLPPVSSIHPNLMVTPPYFASGGRYAGEGLDTLKAYLDNIILLYEESYTAEINQFAQNNIHVPVPPQLRCMTLLYMHSVACTKENENIFDIVSSIIETGLGKLPHITGLLNMLPSKNTETKNDEDSIEYKIAHMPFPGKKYALEAYEFINSTKPESAMLAEEFLSEYHIKVLHELKDAKASLPFINALNPMAHPSEQEQILATLRGCIADSSCNTKCLEGHMVDALACIGGINSATCVE